MDEQFLLKTVKDSLTYCQMWSDITISNKKFEYDGKNVHVMAGYPPVKLCECGDAELGCSHDVEYVVPVEMSSHKEGYFTLECIEMIFDRLCPNDATRFVMALVNDDGTVMFYYVYNGLHEPRKN